jgi:predicted ATPase
MRGFSQLSDRLEADAGNIAGVIAALPESAKKEFEYSIQKYIKQLPEKEINRVYAERVGKFQTDAMLYCEENFIDKKNGSPVVDARGMSDGTLRFLGILTALITRPEGTLLVIEEVDNGLHPSRSHLLLNMLMEIGRLRNVDVLVTTHNPALLDEMGTKMVPFITVVHRDQASGASKLTLLEDIRLLPKMLSVGTVGKLSTKGVIERALRGDNPQLSLSFD